MKILKYVSYCLLYYRTNRDFNVPVPVVILVPVPEISGPGPAVMPVPPELIPISPGVVKGGNVVEDGYPPVEVDGGYPPLELG